MLYYIGIGTNGINSKRIPITILITILKNKIKNSIRMYVATLLLNISKS